MSGSSYGDSDSSSRRYGAWRSSDAGERTKAVLEHRKEVVEVRERVARGEIPKPPEVQRDESKVLDRTLARNTITSPSPSCSRAVVVLVDNSGSNRAIAEHLRKSSGYMTAFCRTVDPGAEIAFVYFSDHGDRDRMLQYTDFVPPTETGDKVLFSSLANVSSCNGHDEPEAIECAMVRASEIDFGKVPKENRVCILVTDSVAHGMGYPEDDGCPDQVSWRRGLASVREAYGDFVVIGSGNNAYMRDFQKRFFESPEGVIDTARMALDFIDLSDISAAAHRNGIVGNAILFVIARKGGRQSAELFLAKLYDKWLKNPLFGDRTDALARKRIRSLAELYLPGIMTPAAIQDMLRDILAE